MKERLKETFSEIAKQYEFEIEEMNEEGKNLEKRKFGLKRR